MSWLVFACVDGVGSVFFFVALPLMTCVAQKLKAGHQFFHPRLGMTINMININQPWISVFHLTTSMFQGFKLSDSMRLILNLLIVGFLKGILWPSLGSIIFSLDKEKQDVCFFCCALASRLAEALGGFGLGQLLWFGFHWRSALACFGGFLVVSFLIGLFSLHGLFVTGFHIEEPMSPSSPTWGASYGAKWFRLFVDFHGWLALLVMLGSSGIWAFSGYLSLLMQDQFKLNPGGAAMAASSLLAGTFLGLLLAGVVTYVQGPQAGRLLQLVQANIALLSLVSMVMMPELSLIPWVLCLLLAGAGAGPLLYLPYTVYCSQVPRSQRAFCMAVLDSLSQLFGCSVRILFGNLRIVVPKQERATPCSLKTFFFHRLPISSLYLYTYKVCVPGWTMLNHIILDIKIY